MSQRGKRIERAWVAARDVERTARRRKSGWDEEREEAEVMVSIKYKPGLQGTLKNPYALRREALPDRDERTAHNEGAILGKCIPGISDRSLTFHLRHKR